MKVIHALPVFCKMNSSSAGNSNCSFHKGSAIFIWSWWGWGRRWVLKEKIDYWNEFCIGGLWKREAAGGSLFRSSVHFKTGEGRKKFFLVMCSNYSFISFCHYCYFFPPLSREVLNPTLPLLTPKKVLFPDVVAARGQLTFATAFLLLWQFAILLCCWKWIFC